MSGVAIHPTAVVSGRAHLGQGVEIGPLCVVGDDVVLDDGCRLVGSCTVLGPTRLGPKNVVFPYAVLGAAPQDHSYEGEPTELVVGADNVFREHVTVHRGTMKDSGQTRVGSRGLFMASVHIGHDARVGDLCTLANGTLLAGHVVLGDRVTAGGRVAIAPFVRVGEGAFLAAGALVERDVPPWMIAAGDRARVRAPNLVGMERAGLEPGSRAALERAFRWLYLKGLPRVTALERVRAELGEDPRVAELVAFLETSDRRRPPRHESTPESVG